MVSQVKMGVALIAIGLILTAGVSYYFGTATTTRQSATVTQTASASSPYILDLVITTNNEFNSTVGDQPAYYVLGPHGLESSATISLPANQMIEVIIQNYDNGSATPSSPEYDKVNGTVGDSMEVIDNNVVNSSEGPTGINITGVQTVSSLNPSYISHTFTVPQLNLNIPVAPSTTEIAYFETGAPGSYAWLCTSPCGSGVNGTQGAMVTAGWMSGTIVVS